MSTKRQLSSVQLLWTAILAGITSLLIREQDSILLLINSRYESCRMIVVSKRLCLQTKIKCPCCALATCRSWHRLWYEVIIDGLLFVMCISGSIDRKVSKFVFMDESFQVFKERENPMGTAYLVDRIYKMNMFEILIVSVNVSGDSRHRLLGHLNSKCVNNMQLIRAGYTTDSNMNISKFSPFIRFGKQFV